MNKLSVKDFDELEKHVVVKGENYGQDRCLVVPVKLDDKDIEVRICMDEFNSVERVCQINGRDITPENELIAVRALKELKKQSKITAYTKEDEEEYIYYLDIIKMNSECCEGNCFKCNLNH